MTGGPIFPRSVFPVTAVSAFPGIYNGAGTTEDREEMFFVADATTIAADDLLYHVDFNVWIRKNDDGTVDLGMTDIAQSMVGNIIHCRPKKAGKAYEDRLIFNPNNRWSYDVPGKPHLVAIDTRTRRSQRPFRILPIISNLVHRVKHVVRKAE